MSLGSIGISARIIRPLLEMLFPVPGSSTKGDRKLKATCGGGLCGGSGVDACQWLSGERETWRGWSQDGLIRSHPLRSLHLWNN